MVGAASRGSRAPRAVILKLRTDAARQALIDRAADAVGRTRSAFVLDAACKAADAVLGEGGSSGPDDGQFQASSARQDDSGPSAKLVEFLGKAAPWEK